MDSIDCKSASRLVSERLLGRLDLNSLAKILLDNLWTRSFFDLKGHLFALLTLLRDRWTGGPAAALGDRRHERGVIKAFNLPTTAQMIEHHDLILHLLMLLLLLSVVTLDRARRRRLHKELLLALAM